MYNPCDVFQGDVFKCFRLRSEGKALSGLHGDILHRLFSLGNYIVYTVFLEEASIAVVCGLTITEILYCCRIGNLPHQLIQEDGQCFIADIIHYLCMNFHHMGIITSGNRQILYKREILRIHALYHIVGNLVEIHKNDLIRRCRSHNRSRIHSVLGFAGYQKK